MLNLINAWWDHLNFELQVFYGIAIVTLIILFFQMALTLIFGADDGLHHIDAMDNDSDVGIFSVRGITAFFTGFGWTGVICSKNSLHIIPTVILAFVVGFSLMMLIYGIMRSLIRLQSDGTLDYANAIGQTATVYLTIPPTQQPGGQIEVMIQGRLVTAQALYKGELSLAPGTKVNVVEKIGSTTLMVQPLN